MENLEKVKLAMLSMQRHSWEQGVAMQALWELGDEEGAIRLAIEAAYRQHDDGRVASIGDMVAQTDPSACGEVLLWAAKKTQMEVLKQAADQLLDFNLTKAPRSDDGILYHMNYDQSFWVDSIYMLPPFLAAAGHYDEAVKQINGYWEGLFIEEKEMLGHRYDVEKQMFQRDAIWATGNGWALAGIARVIDLLPESHLTARVELTAKALTLVGGFMKHLREDKLVHDVLDDPSSYVDGAGTLLFAYGIYRGIMTGWLSPALKELADLCVEAVSKNVDIYGFVREVAGAPHFISSGISPEAQAFYLLAHAAKAKVEALPEEALDSDWFDDDFLDEEAFDLEDLEGIS
ncbi:MAG: glycoside hydrolase family 88 protein [Turicibacter sp.]|nr:glycoside hydrolase family 88 protein [Turicibacter sp.]